MSDKKRKVITIDCETDPFLFGRVPAPFIWGAYDGQTFRTFETGAELVEWLKPQHAVAFAHNGGRFDFLFLQDHFEPWKPIRMINGRIAAFRIGECIFRDSYLILPTALRNYKKGEIDYRLMEREERDKPENRRKILEYLEGDCRYLHELVLGFGKSMDPVLPSLPPPCRISGAWTEGWMYPEPQERITSSLRTFTTVGGFHVSKRAFFSTERSRLST